MNPCNFYFKWPDANNKTEWCHSDGDAEQNPKATARGDADCSLQMYSVIIRIAAEKFVMKHLNTGKPRRGED